MAVLGVGSWKLARRSHPRQPPEAEFARTPGVVVPFIPGVPPFFLAAPAARGQPHLPRPRIHGGIVNCDFVVDRVRGYEREALDDVNVVAKKIADLIEP